MQKQEQMEWDDVNKLLQRHGFKPVHFADPVENKSLSDLLLLDKVSAAEVRATLRVMLTDSERRQQLIQELIRTNSQLKEEVQTHMSLSGAQSLRVQDLERLLDQVRVRVQDLEERCVTEGERKSLTQSKRQAQRLVEDLEQALLMQREEMSSMQKKLLFTVRAEEQRLVRQSETFELVCRRTARQSSSQDQEILDVIGHYEAQMSRLLDERKGGNSEQTTTTTSFSPTFKTMMKAFQEHEKESKSHIENLKKKVERLKQELEARPTLKDLKFYKHKVRRIEKLYNLRLSQDENSEIQEDSDSNQNQKLLSEIRVVVLGPEAPLKLHKQKLVSDSLLPTLQLWAQQLSLLKDLQQSLSSLSVRLSPSQTSETCVEPKVEDLMLLVDTLLENTSTDDHTELRSPTRHTLSSMVSHFQKLFDVSSLSGVYPRMNEVYRRLGEMSTTMRHICGALNLDDRATPAEVVNVVTRLSALPQTSVHDLLEEDHIDSIIQKVKDHDEFFPAFHSFIIDILQTLGLTRLDDVLPALELLKQAV